MMFLLWILTWSWAAVSRMLRFGFIFKLQQKVLPVLVRVLVQVQVQVGCEDPQRVRSTSASIQHEHTLQLFHCLRYLVHQDEDGDLDEGERGAKDEDEGGGEGAKHQLKVKKIICFAASP